ncbi:MAG: hypothetical protein LIP09_12195 [Bacteroidales bacterium]|nr:hypothetical protein [Bacteroidales bacterium]
MKKKELIDAIKDMPDDAEVKVEVRHLAVFDGKSGYRPPLEETKVRTEGKEIIVYRQITEYAK